MPKSIKDLFEVYRPKAKDEADFVDKHVVIKHKDRNGNGDDVFKGNTKYIKRKEERKGYDVGEDEKVYEDLRDQVLQSLIDAAEELGEEFDEETLDALAEEVLSELSPKTMGRYINKAKDQIDAASWRTGYRQGMDPKADATTSPIIKSKEKQLSKRHKGIETAVNKLTKEDAEQIDELSKGTLGSYVKKASTQSFGKGYTGASMLARSLHTRDKEEEKAGEKEVNKGVRRLAGISKATDKLTKEEILNNFINTYIPEDVELPSPQERLVDCLADHDISEQHIHILLSMFESLNEQNQMRMLESVSDLEGINSLLDFAILNRGTE